MNQEEIEAMLSEIPDTPEKVKKWEDECAAGLHPLPADYESRMQKSWDAIKEWLTEHAQQSFTE